MAFAARYPERVDGLGLIDTTASYGEGAPRSWAERAQKALDGGMAALVDFQKSRWFSPGFLEREPGKVQDAIDIFLRNDPRSYAETCRMLGNCDLRGALPHFAFPTRIVVGEEDYATPRAMAEAMQSAIPNATMRALAGVRHFTPIEAPDAIAEEIRSLVEACAKA